MLSLTMDPSSLSTGSLCSVSSISTTSRTVAALYVDTARTAYRSLPNVKTFGFATRDGRQVDAFASTSDARLYGGPWPVVAHPPCGPWGRFHWHYQGGEGDKDCGPVAIEQARKWGGVVEHPMASKLWKHLGLPLPGQHEDQHGGRTVEINQCDFGHPAIKPTWLYVVRATLPQLPPPGEPTHCMVRLRSNPHDLPEVPKRSRHITPPALARWLVELAASATAVLPSGHRVMYP